VPILSRTRQSISVWGGKIAHGWPLILRNAPQLVARFVFGKMR
jgi:hypothetical protein